MGWRKRGRDKNNVDDQGLEDILDRQKKANAREENDKNRLNPKKSRKRQAKDAKFGFGGKKRRSKQNDSSSTADFTQSPWGRKGKGKGSGKGPKGKGKGGKGFGKGPPGKGC